MVQSLRGDDAQAFVDVIDEVPPPHVLSSQENRPADLNFSSCRVADGYSSTVALEEVPENFAQDMRSPGFAPEISANPALLRSIGCPIVSRGVRGRLEGRIPGSPCCSQGIEGLLNERL